MDRQIDAFDELAKDLARGLSRREALRRLAGGAAGAFLASVGLGRLWLSPAQADSDLAACLTMADQVFDECTSLRNADYQKAIAAAEAAFRDCKQACAGKQGKALDACNQTCEVPHQQATQAAEAEQEDQLAICAQIRDADRSICRGECQNNSDCPGGLVCVPIGGAKKCARCQNDAECQSSDEICSQNGECVACPDKSDAGSTPCERACIDTDTDSKNCGFCVATGDGLGEDCTLTGRTCCGGQCFDTQTDNTHCGGCSTPGGATPHGEDCAASGKTCCNGSCVDTMTDNKNCGMCNNLCTGGASCQGSPAQCLCSNGQPPVNGRCGCTDSSQCPSNEVCDILSGTCINCSGTICVAPNGAKSCCTPSETCNPDGTCTSSSSNCPQCSPTSFLPDCCSAPDGISGCIPPGAICLASPDPVPLPVYCLKGEQPFLSQVPGGRLEYWCCPGGTLISPSDQQCCCPSDSTIPECIDGPAGSCFRAHFALLAAGAG